MLKRWWWVPLAVVVALLIASWLLGRWIQGTAQDMAAEAAGIGLERVEVHNGLDVALDLTGMSPSEAAAVIKAVEDLDSSWDVTAEVDEETESNDGDDTEVAADDSDSDDSSSDDDDAADNGSDSDNDEASNDGDSDDADSDDADEAPSDEEPAVELTAPEIVAQLADDGSVTISGTVGDEAARDELIELFGEAFGARNIVDDLSVDEAMVATEGGGINFGGMAVDNDQLQVWEDALATVGDGTGMSTLFEATVAPEPNGEQVESALNALFDLDPVQFNYLAARLRPASIETLERAAEIIKANPDSGNLRIVGHADSDGDEVRNQILSDKRANAVRNYLWGYLGVDPDRLIAEGRGETELKRSPEASADDKQENRRIEWELI